MKKLVSMLTIATFLTTVSFVGTASAAPAPRQGTGSISGTTQGLSGVRVQLRNVDTGQLASSTQSAANGGYSFTGLNAANYVVEIVDAAGKIIGASASISVAAGAVISGVTVAASAAGALAAAAGGAGAFFTSTGGILVLVGVGAGITAGVVAVANETGSASS